MELSFKVFAHISKPVSEVFEAVVDPAILSQYFTTGGAKGRLIAGATVTWDFHDFPGAFPVEVVEVVKDQKLVLHWGDNGTAEAQPTVVTMTFAATDDGRTLVSISEEGWRPTDAGLQASYGNCMGWSQMLCALKIWLEHAVNLRDGMYR